MHWLGTLALAFQVSQGGLVQAAPADDPAPVLAPQTPRFELRLSLIEFSIFHAAALGGVSRYGGDADFRIKLAKEGDQIVTLVTIDTPRLFDVWTYWMAEKSAELLGLTDVDNLGDDAKLALKTAQALNAKLAVAKQNPLYDPRTFAGKLVEHDGALELEAEEGRARIRGELSDELASWKDRSVVAAGYVKAAGELEVTHFVELKQNTLELFTMADCPYGKQAESSLIQYVRGLPKVRLPPQIEVRYIFYERPPSEPDGKPTYWSLHGEKEIQETLVQILIRDMFPWLLQDYLLERTTSGAPWEEIAKKLGLGEADLDVIRIRAKDERDELIRAEYEYATKNFGIRDGSPAYVWEGRTVSDIRSLKAFEGLEFTSPTCSS